MGLLQAASAACGQSRLRVRLALAHDHLASSADPKEAAQAYVAAGNALGCANSTFAKSLTKYLRRMLRDVVVWRCCLAVGFDCRDRLSAEFSRVFEGVDAGHKTGDTEKDLASRLPGCKISTRRQKKNKTKQINKSVFASTLDETRLLKPKRNDHRQCRKKVPIVNEICEMRLDIKQWRRMKK